MENQHTLYGGSVELSMNKNHVYYASIDGAKKQHVPNVTTLLNQKDKSRALMFWQQRCIKEAFEQRFPVGQTFKFDEIQRNRAIETITTAADKESKQARDIGTLVHNYAEVRLNGGTINIPSHPEAANACRAFNNWLTDFDVKPKMIERMCFSKRHNYCGTFDLFGSINGVNTLVDFKTSKQIYSETFLQLSAYQEALEEEMGIEIAKRASLRCDKSDGSYEYLIFPDQHERDFMTFESLMTLYRFDKIASKELREIAA